MGTEHIETLEGSTCKIKRDAQGRVERYLHAAERTTMEDIKTLTDNTAVGFLHLEDELKRLNIIE